MGTIHLSARQLAKILDRLLGEIDIAADRSDFEIAKIGSETVLIFNSVAYTNWSDRNTTMAAIVELFAKEGIVVRCVVADGSRFFIHFVSAPKGYKAPKVKNDDEDDEE
jgi:hypothetical protein